MKTTAAFVHRKVAQIIVTGNAMNGKTIVTVDTDIGAEDIAI